MCIPDKFESVVRECECHRRWKKLTRLGSGANGSAYHACSIANSDDCEYVVKIQPNNALAKRELDAYMRLKRSTVVPKLHAAWLCRRKMYLVLERMYPCSVDMAALDRLLARFERAGWLHVDVHTGNVMCDRRGNLRLIDLGWAVHREDEPYKGHPTKLRWFKELKRLQESNLLYFRSSST